MTEFTSRRWAILCPKHGLIIMNADCTKDRAAGFLRFAKGRRVVRCLVSYSVPLGKLQHREPHNP